MPLQTQQRQDKNVARSISLNGRIQIKIIKNNLRNRRCGIKLEGYIIIYIKRLISKDTHKLKQ